MTLNGTTNTDLSMFKLILQKEILICDWSNAVFTSNAIHTTNLLLLGTFAALHLPELNAMATYGRSYKLMFLA